jgi:type I restriction enzyme M protein
VRGGNKNKLSQANQDKILEAFSNREDIEHFGKLVPNSEIAENDYNLAVSSYIDELDTTVATDITELNENIANIVKKQSELRAQIDAIVAEIEGVKGE